jgi:hypothetical protein
MLAAPRARSSESGLCIGERRLTHNCGVGSVGRQFAIRKGDRETDPTVEQKMGFELFVPAADNAFENDLLSAPDNNSFTGRDHVSRKVISCHQPPRSPVHERCRPRRRQ